VTDPKEFFHEVDPTKPSFTDLNFSAKDIEKALSKLKASSAAGPDGLSASLLKNCRSTLSLPIYNIWRESLNTGTIPNVLKTATIVPIYKGDSRAVPKNYRPVSLTSHLIKTFERVIRIKLVDFLESNQLLNKYQHGFRSKRSCLTQLIEHYDIILEYLEQGQNIDVIYLDFAKAFDKVDHGILAHKLKSLGISGKIGVWLHNFLFGRTQSVVANGAMSSRSKVISGVPQG